MKQKHFWNDVRSLQEQCNWPFIIVQLRCLSGFWKPFHVKLKKRKMILCIQTLNTQQEAFGYKKELQGAKQGSSNLVTKLKSGLPIHSTFKIVAVGLPKLAPLISEKELTFHLAYMSHHAKSGQKTTFFQSCYCFCCWRCQLSLRWL